MLPGNISYRFFSLYLIYFIISALLLIFFIDLNRVLILIVSLLSLVFISLLVLRYKRFLMLLLAFLIPLSIQFDVLENSRMGVPSELICLLLSVFFIFKTLLGYKFSKKFLLHPVTVLILMDLGWMFLSSCFSEMPLVSFKRFSVRLMFYCSFYYFYFELFHQDQKNIKKVFLLYTFGLFFTILFAMFKHAQTGFSTLGLQQIRSPFYFDHTIYGACLVFFIPFLFFELKQTSGSKMKLFFSFFCLLFLVSAFLSYSRAAWISILISVLLYLAVLYPIKIKTILYLLLILVFALAMYWPKINSLLENNRVESHSNDVTLHLKSISNITTDASNKERINRWKCAIRMFMDKPVLGFGPGTYQFFYGNYQQHNDLTRISTFKGNKGHAHSEYLNYLSETGLMGLLIFLCLIAVVTYKSIRLIQTGVNKTVRYTAGFIFMAIVTYFIHGFFNGFLEFDKVAMPIYMSFAAITLLDLHPSSLIEQKPGSGSV